MNIEPQEVVWDVRFVFLRDDERPDACLPCAVRFLEDAADRADAPGERDLARDGDVLPDPRTRNGARDAGEDRRACARSVDVAAADGVDVDVVVVHVLAREPS